MGVIVATVMIVKTRKEEGPKVIPVIASTKVTPVISRADSTARPLEISAPESGAVTDKKTITIKGKATPGSLLIIQSPAKYITQTTEKEEFAVDFPLTLGENTINVTVYPKESKLAVQEKLLLVYVLGEK